MSRTEILNLLIEHYGYTDYLEIGLGDHLNFERINCKHKTGVDPDHSSRGDFVMDSDSFFAQNKKKFDLIFIDGLHYADQVMDDIINSLAALKQNGTIILHDCNPTNEAMQAVPRRSKAWTGYVWKAFVQMRKRSDLEMFTINTDCGCGVIRKGTQQPFYAGELRFDLFVRNKARWLNLISVERFVSMLREMNPVNSQ